MYEEEESGEKTGESLSSAEIAQIEDNPSETLAVLSSSADTNRMSREHEYAAAWRLLANVTVLIVTTKLIGVPFNASAIRLAASWGIPLLRGLGKPFKEPEEKQSTEGVGLDDIGPLPGKYDGSWAVKLGQLVAEGAGFGVHMYVFETLLQTFIKDRKKLSGAINRMKEHLLKIEDPKVAEALKVFETDEQDNE